MVRLQVWTGAGLQPGSLLLIRGRSPPALAVFPSVDDDSMYGNGALSSGVAREPTVTRLRIWRLGVRIPRRAPPLPQLSGPVTLSLPAVGTPDCDQTATTSAGGPEASATTCDHNHPLRLG